MHHNDDTATKLQAELNRLQQQINALKQENKTLHRQRELLRLLAGVNDLDSFLETVVNYSRQTAGLDCGGIYLVQPTGALSLVAHCGLSDAFVRPSSFYPPDAPQTQLVTAGRSVYGYYPDLRPDASSEQIAEGLRAIAVIPIQHQQTVIAALNLASHSRDEILPEARTLLETTAAMLGHVIVRLKADVDHKESQQQYQLLADNIPGIVFHCDIDANWTMHFINRAVETITLYPASDFVQNRVRSFASIIHPADRQYVARIIEQAVEQHQPYSLEYRIINAAGEVRWVFEQGQKISGKNQLIGTIFDITGRKEAEQKIDEYRYQLEMLVSQRTQELENTSERLEVESQARQMVQDSLQQSRILFRNFVDHASDGITLADETGRVIEWNPAMEKITGLDRETAIDRFIWDVQLMSQHPEYKVDRETLKTSYQQLLNAGQAPQIGKVREFLIRHADGSERIVQQSIFVIKTSRGWLTGGILRDVTAAKQAEKALGDSELLYHSLVEHLPQNIFRKDLHGKYIFVNASYCQTIGKSVDQVIGKTDDDLYPPELAKKYQADDRRVMDSGQPWSCTEVYQRADGSHIDVETVKTPVYDSAGNLIGIQGVFWDITASKQAEERVRRRNRELALLNKIIATTTNNQNVETILDAVCRELSQIFDLHFVCALLVNPSRTTATVVAEYRVDSTGGSVLRSEFSIKRHPLYQQLFIQKAPIVITDVRQDARLAAEYELLRLYNTKSMLVTPLMVNDNVLGAIFLNANNRDNFSAEEMSLVWNVADQVSGALARVRLTEAHQRLVTAVEQNASCIFITDKNGVIDYVNSAFEKLSGYLASEVIGQTPALLKSGQQDIDTYRQLWETITTGKTWQGNLVNKSKNGTLFTVDTTITPVRNETGQITSFICVQRDISRELALEEQYRQAQKMEAVGQLTAGIAHDFNNILTGINGFAELMELQSADDSPAKYYAERIKGAGQRAANLIRQLLAFSRKQPVHPEPLQLNTIIANIEKLLISIIGEHIQLMTNLDPDLGLVYMDLGQIEQIIVNLAVNARDAMRNGGTLTIETANLTLTDTEADQYLALSPGDYVQLMVSDNGQGMSQAVKDRIFEPFFTTKAPGKGTGLGLATTYGIVKQSKGHISVYSEEGQGTTFKIYLPRVDQPSSTAGGVSTPTVLPRGQGTILLVEDNADVLDLTQRLLERQGYTVLVAHSAENALEVIGKHQCGIDLLLTDIVLPGMNGKELVEQCVRIFPSLKVIFISGYTSHVVAPEGIKHVLIQKPFSAMQLLSEIKNALTESG